MADKSREWTKFGRYALLDKIGSGGMAEIYRAKTFGAAGFEKEFAIKLILPSLVDDTEFVEMFINEAKIAVSLYHANVVQVFDLGELDEQYYIAMEFVHGKDLLDVLARSAELNVKIPLNLVLFITMEMLKGLDFAHRAKDPYGEDLNIIHRDVSPSNILISYAGDVKVGDFGVAKAAIQRTLTESGTLKGKVGYMSPEQVMGEEIDARSDIFSAGIVFFEALTMSRLFVGGSDLDVMLRVRDADIEPGLKKAGPLPSSLKNITYRALSRHREERYQTAGEFYQALVDFCFQHSIKVTGSDLSNFMRRLFAKEIEKEKSRRRSEPGLPLREPSPPPSRRERKESGEQLARASTASVIQSARRKRGASKRRTSEQTRYRLRDGSGLVFGPMGRDTLVGLLGSRQIGDDDRLSIDGGPWMSLSEVSELRDSLGAADGAGGDSARSVPVGAAVYRRNQQRSAPEMLDPSNEMSEGSVRVGNPMSAESEARDTDVIRDLERAIFAMEELSLATSISPAPEPAGIEVPSTIEFSPSSGTFQTPDGELGGLSSPLSQSAPDVTDKMEPEVADATLKELMTQYASYEGDLQSVSFARILARLHRAKATGRLHVYDEDVEKSIYFRDGEPILVDSNKKDELLGTFLRSRNLISQAQLDEALKRLNEWGGRLGDALVAIGAVPAHEIFQLLSQQMREKLLDIFTWKTGRYGYYENQEPDTQAYSLGIDAYQTIVEGCRERISMLRLKEFYENRQHVAVYLTEPPPVHVDRLKLRAKEVRVMTQLAPGDNLRLLLKKFSLEHRETVYRIVYLLHQTEILAFEITERIPLPNA